jgi:thioredoxin-related protein
MKHWKPWTVLAGLTLGLALLAGGLVSLNDSAEAATKDDEPTMAESLAEMPLKAADGETHYLKDFKGKFVVMEWTNYQCPFVKKFYKPGKMQKMQEKYTEKGVVWLSVCSSAPGKQGYLKADKWQSKAKKHGVKSTALIMDPSGKIGKHVGAKTTPHFYVFDKEGELIYQGAIDSMPSANPDDISKATNYVKEVLGAAMSGETIPYSNTRPYGCSVKYAK